MPFELVDNTFSFCFAKTFQPIFLVYSFIWTSSFTYRETETVLTIIV